MLCSFFVAVGHTLCQKRMCLPHNVAARLQYGQSGVCPAHIAANEIMTAKSAFNRPNAALNMLVINVNMVNCLVN